jgi:predicted DNA-binding protein
MQKKAVLVRMRPELHDRLQAYAKTKDRSMTDIVKDLIETLPDLRTPQS